MSNYEFTKLSEVPAVEIVRNDLNVLVEQDGEIGKVAKTQIGAQADWNETDETSPAYVKNKPEVGGKKYTILDKMTPSGAVFSIDISFNELLTAVKTGNVPDIQILLKYEGEFMGMSLVNSVILADPTGTTIDLVSQEIVLTYKADGTLEIKS